MSSMANGVESRLPGNINFKGIRHMRLNAIVLLALAQVTLISGCQIENPAGPKPPNRVSNMQTIIVWATYDPGYPDGSWMQRTGGGFEAIQGWAFGTSGGDYGGFTCDWVCARSTSEGVTPPVVAEAACNPDSPNCQIPPTHADSLLFSTISKYYVDLSTLPPDEANACRLMEERVAQLWAGGAIFRGNPAVADSAIEPHGGATLWVKLSGSYASFHIDGRYLDLAEDPVTSRAYGPTIAASMLHEAAHTGLGDVSPGS